MSPDATEEFIFTLIFADRKNDVQCTLHFPSGFVFRFEKQYYEGGGCQPHVTDFHSARISPARLQALEG